MRTLGIPLIIIGIVLLVIGLVINVLPRTGIPRLPGDILIQKENFTFYAPITTSIIISIVLTIIFRFLNK